MTTTRDHILHYLKAHGPISAADLAEAQGITVVAVRHHLGALQAAGLVSAHEVRRQVGRPHLAFSLTPSAQERFPTKYIQLSERLLDELKAAMPAPAIEALFNRMAEGMLAGYADRLRDKTLDEKMDVLMDILGAEGFMARWNRVGDTITLTEYNCPYVRLSQRHPEVCAFDRAVIRQVLAADVEQTQCVRDGNGHCTFSIVARASHVHPVTFPASS